MKYIIAILFLSVFINCTNETYENLNYSQIKENLEYEVEEIHSYGLEKLEDNFENEDELIGRISGLSFTPEKELLVLDIGFKKILVYGSDDKLKNIIPTNLGSGPGEFRLPIAMTSGKEHKFVYDRELFRIAKFGGNDTFETFFDFPYYTRSLAVSDSIIWASKLGTKDYGLVKMSLNDYSAEQIYPLSTRDKEYAPDGFYGQVYLSSNNEILFNNNRLGVWSKIIDDTPQIIGNEVFPNLKSYVDEKDGAWVVPIQTIGIGELGDKIVIAWLFTDYRQTEPVIKSFLEVFEPNGERLGRAEFPIDWVRGMETNKDDKSIYVSTSQPYTRVVKFILKEK